MSFGCRSFWSVFNVISCHFRIQCPILSGSQKSYNIYYMIHSVSPSSTSFHALLDAVKSKHSKAKVICVASKWWVNLTYIPMRDMPFWNPIISKPFWQHEISWIPLCLSCSLSGHMRCPNGTKTHFQKLCMERLLIWRWRAKGPLFCQSNFMIWCKVLWRLRCFRAEVCWDTHLYHFPTSGQTWTSQNNGLEQAKTLAYSCLAFFKIVCWSMLRSPKKDRIQRLSWKMASLLVWHLFRGYGHVCFGCRASWVKQAWLKNELAAGCFMALRQAYSWDLQQLRHFSQAQGMASQRGKWGEKVSPGVSFRSECSNMPCHPNLPRPQESNTVASTSMRVDMT